MNTKKSMLHEAGRKENALDYSNDRLFGEAEERLSTIQPSPLSRDFKPWRVFINHIDSYHGKRLADYLSEENYVNLPSDVDSAAEDEDEDEGYGGQSFVLHSKKAFQLPTKYQVIGTARDPKYRCPAKVKMIAAISEDRLAFLAELMTCGFVIYDITQDSGQIEEARWALRAIVRKLEETKEMMQNARCFILLSSVMTWSQTEPLDHNEANLPFTEADYTNRRAHPNFEEHIRCEEDVVTINRRKDLSSKLKTLIICCGITYGYEEGLLYYLFKLPWQSISFLPIIGRGNNRIPLLHVRDLVTITAMAMKSWPSLPYIIAVEEGLSSQKTIVKAIGKALGCGKFKKISIEEAFLLPQISQRVYDCMTVDLNIEPAYIVDRVDQWHFPTSFTDSIDQIVEEFKTERDWQAVKVIVLGPPASGKTRLARYLARHYGLHYIHIKTFLTDTIVSLENDIESVKLHEEEEEEDEEEREDIQTDVESPSLGELQQQLDEIRKNLAVNNGRLDDRTLNKLLRKRLEAGDCQNMGYVMDGYPKTLEQAKDLFGTNDRKRESATCSRIMPKLVVVLAASDDFLIERIISLPEKEIQHTRYTEDEMIRRLRDYRSRNTHENTLLRFFNERGVFPLVISVEQELCPDMFPTIHRCLEKIGEPKNYADKIGNGDDRDREVGAAAFAQQLRKDKAMEEEKRRREEKMIEWTKLMEKLKREEEERLCLFSVPIRHYLAKYVFPTLTQGLLKIAELRPDDPIDFLAEYLLEKNPEGRMFEPDYTGAMSTLLNAIEGLQEDVLPRDQLDEQTAGYLKSECQRDTSIATDECDMYVECSNIESRMSLGESDFPYEGNETFDNPR